MTRLMTIACLLLISFTINAATVTVNGKEWFQPADITSVSWLDLNGVCPGGVCAGSLGTHNLTGWTWASVNEVNELFNHFLDPVALSGYGNYLEAESLWAPAFFSLFTHGGTSAYGIRLEAWTRNNVCCTTEWARLGYISDGIGTGQDRATTAIFRQASLRSSSIGAWLYRDPTVVPIPAAAWLFGSGLLGLVVIARRKKTANS